MGVKVTRREGRILRKNKRKEKLAELKADKPEEKIPDNKPRPDYMINYYKAAEERHPELFKDEDFCKRFYSSPTKGAAKRTLKNKLQEIAGTL